MTNNLEIKNVLTVSATFMRARVICLCTIVLLTFDPVHGSQWWLNE